MTKKLEQKFKGEGIPTTAKVSPHTGNLQAVWRASENPLTPHVTWGTLGIGRRHRVVETTSPCFCRRESPHVHLFLWGKAQALHPGNQLRGWLSTPTSPALHVPAWTCSPLWRVRRVISQGPGLQKGWIAWPGSVLQREAKGAHSEAVSDWLKPWFCPTQAWTSCIPY